MAGGPAIMPQFKVDFDFRPTGELMQTMDSPGRNGVLVGQGEQ
jgi:hypothetical protein